MTGAIAIGVPAMVLGEADDADQATRPAWCSSGAW